MEGSFDPGTWEKTNSQTTIITRDNSNIEINPNRIVAIYANGISNFGIHDIVINVDDAFQSTPSTTVYGIHVSNSSDYYFTRIEVNAGNGSDGVNGTPGTNGVDGADGAAGLADDDDGGGNFGSGGAGGSGSFIGSNVGGDGGSSGGSGGGSIPCDIFVGGSPPDGNPGNIGQPATGTPLGGTGGAGGNGWCWCPIIAPTAPANSNGFAGTNGQDGADGLDGLNGIPSNGGGFFIPGTGQNGQDGEHGAGGGGGGAGGAKGCDISGNNSGAGGGGGGEGGQGGTGATGGGGGGGSFGTYFFNNGTNSSLKDSDINSSLPGLGGTGGAPGGTAGSGGSGGNGGNFGGAKTLVSVGGIGGIGGNGGIGGIGGNGAPGLSNPIYEDPLGTPVAQSDMKSTVEPEIFVANTGCTYSDIQYVTTANGIINWYFDGGAVPLSANGDTAITQYTTMGRHTTTMVADGIPYIFTDYIGIFTDGTPYLPTIVANNDTICPGAAGTFSATFPPPPASFSVLGYRWYVYDTNTAFYSSSTVNHNFNTIGSYLVTLQTQSPCCGWSKIDSFYVHVVPYLEPEIFVTASATTVCDGQSISFGTVPINGGYNPSYNWILNGSSTGITTNTYTLPNPNNGDVIECEMVSSYACPLNNDPIDTSAALTITVNPNPVPVCNVTNTYLGAYTNFTLDTAATTGSSPYTVTWDFGDGSIDTGVVASNFYGGTGNYNYTAIVTDANGCVGYCSGSFFIDIPPYIFGGFDTVMTQICGNTSVTFTDTSVSIVTPNSWQWDVDGDGIIDYTTNTFTHNYTTPGIYSVTLIVSNGVFTDTVTYPNHVQVLTVPDANFASIETVGCEPFTAQFIPANTGVVAWQWDFGDGSTSNLPSPSHIYQNAGIYTVELTVWSIDGCIDVLQLPSYITVYESPVAIFDADKTLICAEDSIAFTDLSTINPPDYISNWDWNFGDWGYDTLQNPTHTYNTPGTYDVTLIVTNSFGCPDTLTKKLLIDVLVKPEALFTVYTAIVQLPYEEVQFYNQSINYYTWLWDFGDETSDSQTLNPSKLYEDSGHYDVWLHAIHQLGCRDSMMRTIIVLEQESYYVPNTFTPNDDGRNDVFNIYGKGIVNFEMTIYNRWGDLIYETQTLDKGWDGTLKDKPLQEGVYIYKASFDLFSHKYTITNKGEASKTIELVGKVQLIRSL